jgi:hypothetical protein
VGPGIIGSVHDWVGFHDHYDRPDGDLARRLATVRGFVAEALETTGSASPRILSLCAGDGRDVLGVLAEHPRGPDASVLLVDLDPTLVERARQSASSAGLAGVEARRGDAADPELFADFGPADLLLLCGIFGNIDTRDLKRTVRAVPALLAPGGRVIWTRGGDRPDLRPRIRRWFARAGLAEVSYRGAPERYGVGVNRQADGAQPERVALPSRLFTFRR